MTGFWLVIDNGDGTAREQSMDVGKYYWVLVTSSRKSPEWQPARFTGMSLDSVGMSWDFIGFLSTDGHHFVDVLKIGNEIVAP